MTQKPKTKKMQMRFLFTKSQKEILTFLCHNFWANWDLDLLSTSNDSLNLCFHIVGKQMAKNCSKMVIYQMQILVINLWFNQDQVWPHATFCVITFQPIKI